MHKHFLLNGITTGFQLLPKGTDLKPTEIHNYFSSLNSGAKDKVEATLLDELASGNYLISDTKPRIVSASGAVPKPDSEELLRLIHDCSMPAGLGVLHSEKWETYWFWSSISIPIVTCVPLSIANAGGSRQGTAKSKLKDIIYECMKTETAAISESEKDSYVLDMIALIRTMSGIPESK